MANGNQKLEEEKGGFGLWHGLVALAVVAGVGFALGAGGGENAQGKIQVFTTKPNVADVQLVESQKAVLDPVVVKNVKVTGDEEDYDEALRFINDNTGSFRTSVRKNVAERIWVVAENSCVDEATQEDAKRLAADLESLTIELNSATVNLNMKDFERKAEVVGDYLAAIKRTAGELETISLNAMAEGCLNEHVNRIVFRPVDAIVNYDAFGLWGAYETLVSRM